MCRPAFGRQVAIEGRSLVESVERAQELGYLDVPDNTLVPRDNAQTAA